MKEKFKKEFKKEDADFFFTKEVKPAKKISEPETSKFCKVCNTRLFNQKAVDRHSGCQKHSA